MRRAYLADSTFVWGTETLPGVRPGGRAFAHCLSREKIPERAVKGGRGPSGKRGIRARRQGGGAVSADTGQHVRRCPGVDQGRGRRSMPQGALHAGPSSGVGIRGSSYWTLPGTILRTRVTRLAHLRHGVLAAYEGRKQERIKREFLFYEYKPRWEPGLQTPVHHEN